MGDMADFINDSYNHWDGDDEFCGYTPKVVACKYCGEKDVVWKQLVSGKWCIHDAYTMKPHSCKPFAVPVPRTGKNSNKKELTGYKLVTNKCCSTCRNYSYEKDAELCLKHDYFVVSYGYCNDWKSKELISVKPTMIAKKNLGAISGGIEPVYDVNYRRKFPSMKEKPQSIEEQYRSAKICPHCGDRAGFSFGTGDCGCESSPDVGW